MGHHHEEHKHVAAGISVAFYVGIALNAVFTVVEFVVGYTSNSLALISDASHNLSDVAGLIVSLLGMKLAQRVETKAFTYGYKKASILASLINAILLVYIVVNILIEGVARLGEVPEVVGEAVIVTALIGVVINTVSAFLFYKGQKSDINVRGAFLHLMVDAVVSLGVVVSGVVMMYTGWNIIDPIISFVIAVVIFVTTWGLLKESIKLTLDGTPSDVDLAEVERVILRYEQVERAEHLHVWALSSTQNALTVHLWFKEEVKIDEALRVKDLIKEDLKHVNIQHSTLEFC